ESSLSLPSSVSFSCSFPPSRAHLYLHSFPTRRSSDLISPKLLISLFGKVKPSVESSKSALLICIRSVHINASLVYYGNVCFCHTIFIFLFWIMLFLNFG